MSSKILFSFIACFSFSLAAFSQIAISSDLAAVEKSNTEIENYVIQVDISSDSKKYFPKLYPIGYIIKKTDPAKKMTKYLLGDFSSRAEASQALVKVKESGYKSAFIIRMADLTNP